MRLLPPPSPSSAARPMSRLAPVAIACGLALHGAAAHAQFPAAAAGDVPTLRTLDARVRLGAEKVKLPGDTMGLVGLTELLNVGGEWWADPGVYGAATGRRGGFFVPGVEGAWSHPFSDLLALDAGVFV